MTAFFRATVATVVCFLSAIPVWADRPAEKPTVKIEFRRAEREPAEGLTEATVAGTTKKIYLHKSADATNKDIAEASEGVDAKLQPAVDVTFTEQGARKMAKLSEEHAGKPLAILVDGKVISAPVVRSKFSKKAQLTGLTKDEVEKIVKGINGK